VDDFGFDPDWTETLVPLSAWMYRNWWRVRAIGVENVPVTGRALLVSNHAGVIPYDGAMVRTALLLEHSRPRHARALRCRPEVRSSRSALSAAREIHPNHAEIPGAAKPFGLPYAPVTPTLRWLGPAGLIPLPSSWILQFHELIHVAQEAGENPADPGRVLANSDQVRDVIQAGVYRNLQRRQTGFALS
jgi:hypothetical protein